MTNRAERDKAKAQGLTRYFTGKPCKYGHVSERNTKTGKCLECRFPSASKWREYNARWVAKYPGRDKEVKYRHRYGVELSEVGDRPDTCQICGGTERISLDHCHVQDAFRGWLCIRCNTILGLAKDSSELLESLVEYLQRPSSGVFIDREKAIRSKTLRTKKTPWKQPLKLQNNP